MTPNKRQVIAFPEITPTDERHCAVINCCSESFPCKFMKHYSITLSKSDVICQLWDHSFTEEWDEQAEAIRKDPSLETLIFHRPAVCIEAEAAFKDGKFKVSPWWFKLKAWLKGKR